MVKLIVSDMDGTLLGHHSSISNENVAAIKWAIQHGAKFVIATGRHLSEAKPILDNVGISCPFLTVNGAAIYNEHVQLQQHFALNHDTVKQVVTLAQQNEHFLVELTTVEAIISDNPTLRKKLIRDYILEHLDATAENIDELVAHHASFLKATYVSSLLEYMNEHPDQHILKVLISCTDASVDLAPIKQQLQQFEAITVSSSHPLNVEVTAPLATKGYAVTQLAQSLNIPLSDVMVLGDNMNDYSMFEVAGVSVAMANAVDPLKAIASFITSHHLQHGVADAIYHYFPKEVSHESI